jgi:chromosome segregation ATPase
LEFHPNHYSAINLISSQIRNAEVTLYSLQSNRNAITNQLQSIQSQVNQLTNEYTARVNQIEGRYKKLNNTARRNQAKLAKIATGPEIADGKKGARKSRLNALTSYYDLPIELYRQQLLDLVAD